MARINTARVGVFLQTVMTILKSNPNGLAGREVLDEMERQIVLSDEERGYYRTNPRENRARVCTRWWTVNLVKAGWIDKSKTAWNITELGSQQLEAFPDPEAFALESRRRYQQWRRENNVPEPVEVEIDTELQVAAGGLLNIETLEEDEYSRIRKFLSEKDPYDFQDIIAALLIGLGYTITWKAPPGPDGGFDIVAVPDSVGARGAWVKVQVKRTTVSKVGVQPIREFLSTVGDGEIGLFVAFSGFTEEARKTALHSQQRRLRLLDIDEVIELWAENYPKLSESAKRMIPLRNIWFLVSPQT